MECKMVAIMFNVDHPFSLYSFICLCCFFSFFPPLLLTEPSRMQEGAAKNETAGGGMKKSAIWANGLGGEAECATTRQRWRPRPLLLIENFFFNYLSVLALSLATEKERERRPRGCLVFKSDPIGFIVRHAANEEKQKQQIIWKRVLLLLRLIVQSDVY